MSDHAAAISGIILAGGHGLRMGGNDKGWQEYQARPLIEHVYDRLQDQVDDIVISCNRNLQRYGTLAPAIPDQSPNFAGPLAGITAAAPHCRHQWLQLCPCDTPHIPLDLSAQLLRIALSRGVDAVVPRDHGGSHYLCALVHRRTLPAAATALACGQFKVRDWLEAVGAMKVSAISADNAFMNINRREQLTAPPAS